MCKTEIVLFNLISKITYYLFIKFWDKSWYIARILILTHVYLYIYNIYLDPYLIFLCMHCNHCHRTTTNLQLNVLLLLLLLLLLYLIFCIGYSMFPNYLLSHYRSAEWQNLHNFLFFTWNSSGDINQYDSRAAIVIIILLS
jgi:hypothetical protein